MRIDVSQVANLPTKYGNFKIKTYKEGIKEHLAIYTENIDSSEVINVRIHSECLTGDVLKSCKCDCGEQLDYALKYISQNGGMILYLRQEGRDIGLLNKVNAYALQDKGFDTIQANHQLGFEADQRSYEIVDYILNDFKITKINLLTNNPNKINSLKDVTIEKRLPILIEHNEHNKDYLDIKKEQMGHLL
jgi:GTP cyclohydrolase II